MSVLNTRFIPSARSEGDDAATRFAGLQGAVGLVDLLDRVAAGEQLIQLEVPARLFTRELGPG